jgi:hypothetical protein
MCLEHRSIIYVEVFINDMKKPFWAIGLEWTVIGVLPDKVLTGCRVLALA